MHGEPDNRFRHHLQTFHVNFVRRPRIIPQGQLSNNERAEICYKFKYPNLNVLLEGLKKSKRIEKEKEKERKSHLRISSIQH